VPARAQSGLKDSWKAQGYFLACVCHPENDLTIAQPGEEAKLGATIRALNPLSHDVMQVRLHCDAVIDFRAGQYVTIIREDGLSRSYSVASLPEDGDLELHVRRIAGGRMSGWLHDQAKVGDRVSVLGPSGECFYVPGREDQPLVLAGTGTGLAPLYGILRDALRQGHHGPVHLFHGALHRRGLYLMEELRRLVARHPHVEYTPTVLNADSSEDLAVGPIDQVLLKRLPKLTGWRGFVCGDPALVKALKKKLFLAGMASRDIYADAFLPAVP
jgi:NAD(P)H-flavin reductase